MFKKPWLYFALGITTVISIGAAATRLVSATSTGVAVSSEAITFPDGTVQSTAYYPVSGELVQGATEFYVTTINFCSLYESLYTVPPGKVLEITWVSVQITSYEAIVDPVRLWIQTWAGPSSQINHPLAYLDNMSLIGSEIFPNGSWHSMVNLVSVSGQTVKVRACKASDAGDLNVRVTFSGRLYDVAP